MNVSRKDLLNKLLLVSPGVSTKESIQQSSCVVLRRGRFYTMNREVACSLLSGLPEEADGAVRAERLIELLKRMTEDEVGVEVTPKTLTVKGKGKSLRLALEAQVYLPVDDVDRPPKTAWVRLDPDFAEAADLSHRVCKTHGPKSSFTQQCVHIHPEWLEASDNHRMIRYAVKTFVRDSVLVRGATLKSMVQLGMTRAAETDSWLHFWSPLGLRLSLRKFALESYPDFRPVLDRRGDRLAFPKGSGPAAERVGLFEDVTVKVSKGKTLLECRDDEAEYNEELASTHKGSPLSFSVPSKLLKELLTKDTNCEVTKDTLRLDGGKYVYVASLRRS